MLKQSVTAVDISVGKRIQKRRKELGVSAAVLSEKLEISQQQLSRYERGTNKISLGHLAYIGAYLAVPVSWFFLDCQLDVQPIVREEAGTYSLATDDELRERFDQRWTAMSSDQRRALVSFLDYLPLTPK